MEKYIDKFDNYIKEIESIFLNHSEYKIYDYDKLNLLASIARKNVYYYVNSAKSDKDQLFLVKKIINECDKIIDKWKIIYKKLPSDILNTDEGCSFCYIVKDIEQIKSIYSEKYLIKSEAFILKEKRQENIEKLKFILIGAAISFLSTNIPKWLEPKQLLPQLQHIEFPKILIVHDTIIQTTKK